MEHKARRVRTPEGAEHYGQPIGSVIVADATSTNFLSRARDRVARSRTSTPASEKPAQQSTPVTRAPNRPRNVSTSTAAPKRGRGRPKTAKITKFDSGDKAWQGWEYEGERFLVGRNPGDEGAAWVALDANDGESIIAWADSPGEAVNEVERYLGIYKEPETRTDWSHLEGRLPTDEERAQFREVHGVSIPPAWGSVQFTLEPGNPVIARGINPAGKWQSLAAAHATGESTASKFKRLQTMRAHIRKLDEGLGEEALTDDTAAAVLLMRRTGIRVGSSDYQRGAKQAFGATTLRHEHVSFEGDALRLRFTAKEGIDQDYTITDPEVVAAFRARYNPDADPSERFFPKTHSDKTIDFIRKKTGKPFLNHDLRTYFATQYAQALVRKWRRNPPTTAAEFKRMRMDVAKSVSAQLGNNPQQALQAYIDPAVFSAYEAQVSGE